MIRNLILELVEREVGKFGVETAGIVISRSADPKFGDFSTNVAMKISRDLKQLPMETANKLADRIKEQDAGKLFSKVVSVSPGFINFFVKDEIWQSEVENVLKEGQRYGSNESSKGKKARVEFVSANPTGPLHFGNARGGPIGDTLAGVLAFSGYEVLREYLHNDVGEQVRKLGESILNVAGGAKLEDQEYKGEYIRELATKLGDQMPETRDKDITAKIGKLATDMMLDETLADCEAMGIKFDKVYPESGFVTSGDTERAIAELDKKGFIKEKDGAKWFAPHLRSSSSGGQANDEFLKDRETVVIKSDGSYTYFSNDIAYHKIKFSEGYDLVVDIFGANHHGHVPRLQAVVKALGGDVTRFHVILYQWVRFKKGGEVLAMSKRSGNFITAREVLEMVGSDAVRFFVLMHDANSHIDFDLDLAREKSNKNPVFYVQYAHARIASILGKAERPETRDQRPETRLLSTPYELELIKKISKLPELVEDIASSFAVNALTTYATELADSFHKFYENCRVLPREVDPAFATNYAKASLVKKASAGEEVSEELTAARLALVAATKITLANTLNLLGISAPEKM